MSEINSKRIKNNENLKKKDESEKRVVEIKLTEELSKYLTYRVSTTTTRNKSMKRDSERGVRLQNMLTRKARNIVQWPSNPSNEPVEKTNIL